MRYFLMIFSILFSIPAYCQSIAEKHKEGIRLFLDCDGCDFDYIKTEINYVDFVPDRFSANVYILPTGQPTGSGGSKITVFFYGQKEFQGINDTLVFYFGSTETDAEIRKKGTQYLQLGLMRYLARTDHALDIDINSIADSSKADNDPNSTTNTKDKWNYWVFNVGVSGSYDEDDFSSNENISGRINISRITEKSKIYLYLGQRSNTQKYMFDSIESKFINKNIGFSATYIKSITDHWSAGIFSNYTYSTYSNYKKQIEITPAIEYSFFKYEDVIKKSITLFYQAGPSYNEYIDSGYYDSPTNMLYSHSLSLDISFIQKWGTLNVSSSYNSFLNPFYLNKTKIKGSSVNNFSVGASLNIRIVKGLSANINASADYTKGILPNISRLGFSRDDLLTNTRQYPTGKNIYMGIGLNYRFGSIYNNVVNPRFQSNGY